MIGARLLLTLCLLAGMTGCARSEAQMALHREAALWLDAHALPKEALAAQEATAFRRLTQRALIALPTAGGAAAVIEALEAARPAYCLALRSVVWEGVQADPWFGEHYRQVFAGADAHVGAAPVMLYRYTSSPFDGGEALPIGATRVDLVAGQITVEAARLSHPSRILPGELLYVTLALRGNLREPLRAVLTLRALADGRTWFQTARGQPGGASTDAWPVGRAVEDRYVIAPPAALPPGDYALELAFFRPNDAPLGEPVTLAQLSRPPEVARVAQTPDHAVQVALGDAIALLGYDAPAQVAPDDTFAVSLYWRALAPTPGDYKVFVHLFSFEGALVAQHDGQPVNWAYPTTAWQAGDYILDRHAITLTAGLARGDYRVVVGMYDAAAPDVRLPVRDAQGVLLPDGQTQLYVLRVR